VINTEDTAQLRHGSDSASMTSARTAVTAAALTATLGLAAASWVVAVRQMHGMDMGVATRPGSFGFFVALWVLMMAAMQSCRDSVGSGFEFGVYCVGSSIGLMLILVALSVMSIAWMAIVAVLVVTQKLAPRRAAVDAPLAVATVGLGVLIIIAPASVPGLMPSM
jgi:hypothetical protein